MNNLDNKNVFLRNINYICHNMK